MADNEWTEEECDVVTNTRNNIETGRTHQTKKLTCAVNAVLSIVNMILLLSFACLAGELCSRRYAALEPRESRICVPSTEFHSNRCPEIVTTQNTRGECCGKVSDILDVFLSKSIEREFEQNRESRLYYTMKCPKTMGQRPIFNANGFSTVTNDKNAPLKWIPDESTSTNPNSTLKYEAGKVYVTETGNYFLHSQLILGYRLPPAGFRDVVDNKNGKSVTYYLVIKHFSFKKGRERIMLKTTRHHCIKAGQEFNVTLSTGAVIFLEERDHVYVLKSHPDHIIQSPHDNRFTIFPLRP